MSDQSEVEVNAPDDFSVDFTDVEAAGGFTPLPRGQYLLEVVDWEITETKNAGKLPVGTQGIKWEFNVVENEQYEDRKLWTSHWLAASSMKYLKGFLEATGVYEEGELDAPLGDIRQHADRVVAETPRVTANVVIQKDNPLYNNIVAFLPESEYKGAQASSSTSLMP